MKLNDLNKQEKLVAASSFVLFLVSFVLIKLNGFSVSGIVNLQGKVINSIIVGTAGAGTVDAMRILLGVLLDSLAPLVLSLVFFALALSVLAYYGSSRPRYNLGIFSGAASAVAAYILFQSMTGAFLAAGVFVASYFTIQTANMYAKELKKWVFFRTGSKTVSRMMMVSNALIVAGIFFSVLSIQASYEETFRDDLQDLVKDILPPIPGTEFLPDDIVDAQIDSAIDSALESPVFKAYITWLPVTTAIAAWFVLELLKNLVFANASGLFTYLALRKSGKKSI